MPFKQAAIHAAQFTVAAGGIVAMMGLTLERPRLVNLAFNPLFWVTMFALALLVQRFRPAKSSDKGKRQAR